MQLIPQWLHRIDVHYLALLFEYNLYLQPSRDISFFKYSHYIRKSIYILFNIAGIKYILCLEQV